MGSGMLTGHQQGPHSLLLNMHHLHTGSGKQQLVGKDKTAHHNMLYCIACRRMQLRVQQPVVTTVNGICLYGLQACLT